MQFLDRAQGLDEPRQVTGPVDHRDQGSDGDADQAEFQDEGDCGHEVKDGFDYRDCLGHQKGKAALIRCWGKLFLRKTLDTTLQRSHHQHNREQIQNDYSPPIGLSAGYGRPSGINSKC